MSSVIVQGYHVSKSLGGDQGTPRYQRITMLSSSSSIPVNHSIHPIFALLVLSCSVFCSSSSHLFGAPLFICCFFCNFWARRFSLRFALAISSLFWGGRGGGSKNCSGGPFVSSFGASLRDRLNLFSSAFVGRFALVGGAAMLILSLSVCIQSDMSIDAVESGDLGGSITGGGGGGGGGGGVSSGGGGGMFSASRRSTGEGEYV